MFTILYCVKDVKQLSPKPSVPNEVISEKETTVYIIAAITTNITKTIVRRIPSSIMTLLVDYQNKKMEKLRENWYKIVKLPMLLPLWRLLLLT